MKFRYYVGALSVLMVCLLNPTIAQAKPARCDIINGDRLSIDRYIGPCDFRSKSGGSFDLILPEAAEEKIYTHYLSLEITSPGRGRIEAAVTSGIAVWDGVRRDPKKPACWFNSDIRVCVY